MIGGDPVETGLVKSFNRPVSSRKPEAPARRGTVTYQSRQALL
jgi:hypothetical protein